MRSRTHARQACGPAPFWRWALMFTALVAACGGGSEAETEGPEDHGLASADGTADEAIALPASLEGRPAEFALEPAADLPCDEGPESEPGVGTAARIPVVVGLTLASTWVGQAGGDDDYEHECLSQVTVATAREVVIATSCPAGRDRVLTRGSRRVCRADLRTGRIYIATRGPDSPEMVAGTTADLLSRTTLGELHTVGRSWHRHLRLQRRSPLAGFLDLAREMGLDTGGMPTPPATATGDYEIEMDLQGELLWIGADTLHLLVNDRLVPLPVVGAAGELHHAAAAEPSVRARLTVLDDPLAPWVLDYEHEGTGYRVRHHKITFPAPDALEHELAEDGQATVYGIYFELGSDALRDESEAVLTEIAEVMRRNPQWKLGIHGHTDAIGSDGSNLELSRRRADAVKGALVERHGIDSERLATEGYGASRPRTTNETLEGRSRNRRVELVRQ